MISMATTANMLREASATGLVGINTRPGPATDPVSSAKPDKSRKMYHPLEVSSVVTGREKLNGARIETGCKIFLQE